MPFFSIIIPVFNSQKYLKSCLDITESHITWGTKNVKEKYSKIKERLQLKLKEQYIDKRYYESLIDE